MDIIKKLESIHERYKYLEERLSDPEIVSNVKEYTKTSKEYKDLQPIMNHLEDYQRYQKEVIGAEELLSSDDPEMKDLARLEYDNAKSQLETIEAELKIMLIPKDPEDSKDVIFEIRAGTGGSEASLFAGDLLRMYTRYFDTLGWTYEILTENEGSVGGFSKVVLDVSGVDVYGKLKFESGAHRVQRVPETEASGRVHTSAATVVVMPKMEIEDIDVNKADLRVDTFRSSGAGGQHVNKTESGVRFTHIPTGKRRSLVGTGDRSDKIRTYNFPQNRMTDHRINFTSYNLVGLMNGQLDEVIEALRVAENMEKLKGEQEQ